MLKFLFVLVTLVSYHVTCTPSERVVKSVISSSNAVSTNVYNILAKDTGNVLFCPISSNLLLTLLTFGARGRTAQELKDGLELSGENNNIKNGYKNLLQQLNNDTLKLATRIYPKTGVTLKKSFLQIAQEYFKSDVEEVDYNKPEDASNVINTFVARKTNNKIQNLISADSITSDTTVILVNAAHFKDEWVHPFKNIYDGTFYETKDRPVQTTLMEVTERFMYAEVSSLNAQVVQLHFKNDEYSMVFILPKDVDGIQDLETKLSTTSWESIIKDLVSTKVKVTLPKFKIESSLDLTSVLKQLGVKTVFTGNADLSGIMTGPPLAVSQVLQKTYIDVNKDGVEAAAATAILIATMSLVVHSTDPVEFNANHPFIFAILYKDLVLFQGKVSNV